MCSNRFIKKWMRTLKHGTATKKVFKRRRQGWFLFQEGGRALCGAWAGGGSVRGWGSGMNSILEKRAELLSLGAWSWGPGQGGWAGPGEPGGGALKQETFEHLPEA